jgi:trehalose 6-phosphate synthase/phosphatase
MPICYYYCNLMPQIIIVSNRLPVSVTKEDGVLGYSSPVGGLAMGLSSFIKTRRNKWVGWPGIANEKLTEKDRQDITTELAKRNCIPVFLTQKQINDFYGGYSNSLLWPLLHNLKLNDGPDHERWWKAYRTVNQLFTDVAISNSQRNSILWIQDYLLFLMPTMLRSEVGADMQIGFFLHVPFPAYKTFAKLPEHLKLLEGLSGANLIGFHTKSYAKNFLQACQITETGTVGDGQLVVGDRAIRVTDFPLGIDYEKFASASKLPEVKKAVAEYKKRYRGQKIIASAERLDISKGYVERLKAYQKYLASHPKMRGKVVFVLVGAPSRSDLPAYKRLSDRVDKLARDINIEFGTKKWQPLEYIHQAIPFESVAALFQVADVAFIAPLRDGMNLTPKEYIATKRKNGVLILSDTTGAAEELHDAVMVSHRDPDSLVRALDQALHMRKREVRRRLKNMQKQLSTNTFQTWSASFLNALQQPLKTSDGSPRARTRTLNDKWRNELELQYKYAQKRLILLDYDGTLISLREDYSDAAMSETGRELLTEIAADPKNEVVVVSGRDRQDLDTWLGDLPLSFVAEHGAYTRLNGSKSWKSMSAGGSEWKKVVRPILEKYTAETPEAEIEEKAHSLVWHYRKSPTYYAQKYSVIIKKVLKPILKRYGLVLYNGSKILEIKDPAITKGTAIVPLLLEGYDFVMVIGDDYTDEDMFAATTASAFSIKVGPGRSVARFRLPTYQAVRGLLHSLSKPS